jgi:predicted RNA-binding protein YlqC (UPF0109 family)
MLIANHYKMKDLIKHIIKNIVDNPDQVQITESESDYGLLNIDIQVHPEDMGKIIGKGGRIISSIRKIAKAKAVKMGRRVQINLLEQ